MNTMINRLFYSCLPALTANLSYLLYFLNWRLLHRALLIAAILSTSTNGYAQGHSNETFDSLSLEDLLSLEDIVVTSQKKAESMQDTPIALSVYNTRILDQLGAKTAADISDYTPNTHMIRTMGSNYNIGAFIRGLGNGEPSLAIDPKVGIYLDGVYIARNSGAIFDVLDLERIEVLRGPQGTLWGKNTTGGAINMISKKPKGMFSFKHKLSVGNDGYFRSASTVNTATIANISSTFSFAKKETDGWATNTSEFAEEKLGSEETDSNRIASHWDVSDMLSVDYIYDMTDAESIPMPVQIDNVSADTTPGLLTLVPPAYTLLAPFPETLFHRWQLSPIQMKDKRPSTWIFMAENSSTFSATT